MQLQWEKTELPILRGKIWEVQTQEQTQEVRLGEGMPDVGTILCGWGQPMLRGKEWHDDQIGISGGIQAWVLYAPEDGSAARCVEAWLPFQMKWTIPQAQRDGVIRTDIALRSVDARVLSARKLLIRAQVSVLGEGSEPDCGRYVSAQVSDPSIQLLQQSYPIHMPVEAGEKDIRLEEDVTLPSAQAVKTISCTVQPEMHECRVVGDKAVLRGECHVQVVYFGADEQIYSDGVSVPFAQYAQLEREYDKDATLSVLPVPVNMEQELLDGVLRLKYAFAAQYIVLDRVLVEVAQDAYSLTNDLEMTRETTQLPSVLDRRTIEQQISKTAACPYRRIVDAVCYREQPTVRRNGEQIDVETPVMAQLLCRADDGQYTCVHIRFADQWSIPVGTEAAVGLTVQQPTAVEASCDGENVTVHIALQYTLTASTEQDLNMITEIEVGDKLSHDAERPSFILRRAGEQTLWELAKQYGSTVADIQKENGLEQMQLDGRMLLIPIS